MAKNIEESKDVENQLPKKNRKDIHMSVKTPIMCSIINIYYRNGVINYGITGQKIQNFRYFLQTA